ncbi:hypothetical protein ACFSYD_18565 [Paracoccus aerius]
MGDADRSRCLAGVHRGSENADHRHMVGYGRGRQCIIRHVDPLVGGTGQNANRLKLGWLQHLAVGTFHSPYNAAACQKIGPGAIQNGAALKLVGGVTVAQAQNHQIARVHLGHAAIGQLELAVLAQFHDPAQDQIARNCGVQIRRKARQGAWATRRVVKDHFRVSAEGRPVRTDIAHLLCHAIAPEIRGKAVVIPCSL